MSSAHVHRGAARAAPITAPHRCRFEPLGRLGPAGGLRLPAMRGRKPAVAHVRGFRCTVCDVEVRVTARLVSWQQPPLPTIAWARPIKPRASRPYTIKRPRRL